MNKQVRLDIPQKLLPLLRPKRYKIVHGGRGSAKSWTVARVLLAMAAQKPLRVLCGRETQKSIAESVHHTLASQIKQMGIDNLYEVQEQVIYGCERGKRTGTEFHFAGLRQQGITNIKSYEDFDILWIEEGQVISKRTMEIAAPTFRKPGSEIWITLNPELEDDYIYANFVANPPENALVIECNWRDNPWFTKELNSERLRTQQIDPNGYKTIWGGQCRPAVEGAIYAAEIEAAMAGKRILRLPHDPSLKVHTVWDLGWSDQTAIICVQRTASEVRVIDYIEGNKRTLAEYVIKLDTRKWSWGTDWLPHDGRAGNLQTGKSPEEALKALGRKVSIVPNMAIEQGISAARMMFSRVYFDKDKTPQLVNALKRYKRKQMINGAFGAPEHDENSHAADAFRYLAVIVDKLNNAEFAQSVRYPSMGHH